mgnify:CR=1 FL=1
MSISLTGGPRTPKYVPPTIPYEIQHILGSAGKVAGKVAGGRPTRPGHRRRPPRVVPTYEVTPCDPMAHTLVKYEGTKATPSVCVNSAMGRGGGGSPLYMQFGHFHLCHERTYFFLK